MSSNKQNRKSKFPQKVVAEPNTILVEKEPTVEQIALLQDKHPNVCIDKETLTYFKGIFDLFEFRLSLKNIELRGVSNFSAENVLDVFSGHISTLTFHWVCRNKKDSPGIFLVKYSPTERDQKAHPKYFLRKNGIDDLEQTRQAYLDLRDSLNEGDRITPTYTVADPLPELNKDQRLIVQGLMGKLFEMLEADVSLMSDYKHACARYIASRFAFYNQQFGRTRNVYYLERGNFFRKLTVGHLDMYHILLVAAIYRNWPDESVIERELREAFPDVENE